MSRNIGNRFDEDESWDEPDTHSNDRDPEDPEEGKLKDIDPTHAEVMGLFGQRQELPAGFQKGYGPSHANDVGVDYKGNPVEVHKPDNPEERNY